MSMVTETANAARRNGSREMRRVLLPGIIAAITIAGYWFWVQGRRATYAYLENKNAICVVGFAALEYWNRTQEVPPSVQALLDAGFLVREDRFVCCLPPLETTTESAVLATRIVMPPLRDELECREGAYYLGGAARELVIATNPSVKPEDAQTMNRYAIRQWLNSASSGK